MAVINSYGRTIKPPKGNLQIIYQIDVTSPTKEQLLNIALAEAWSDNYFYFSLASFKRSGEYAVSFFVEDGNGNGIGIKPLVFPVTVTSRSKQCGPRAALDRLLGCAYVEKSHRQFSSTRRRGGHLDVFGEVSSGGTSPLVR